MDKIVENRFRGADLTIENFSFTYPNREQPALSEVSLTVRQGEFIVLCGPSGCGKTTLLRQCKTALAPHGMRSGSISFDGQLLESLSDHDAAARIGFVQQSPENQIVTDKVWHELAFGLESLGYDKSTIRLRVAEMASFFGIQGWFYRPVTELSGGQKQLLALASIMAMQPSVLILDEPTSQLDPIAAAEFLSTVGKINRELGITVLLTEHRLEEAFPLCTSAVVMEEGHIICEGTPGHVGEYLRETQHGMFLAMPTSMRVWAGVENHLPCPVTVRDGRDWLNQLLVDGSIQLDGQTQQIPDAQDQKTRRSLIGTFHKKGEQSQHQGQKPVVELEEVWFKYDKDLPDVVKGLSFEAYSGEITALLGGNGTGKTTTLSLIAGLNTPYRGKARINGQDVDKTPNSKLFNRCLGVLPQNPQSLFVAKTVEEDLLETLSESGLSRSEKRERMYRMARLCRLTNLMASHPYDLSGGEQQRAALAKVLLLEPKILLLDEPTKGLDADFKRVFSGILHRLSKAGVAIVIVSHDIEFCAEYADRCALFFDGGIVTQGTPTRFFSGNSFYTSAANRMARHVLPEAVTAADVIVALGGDPLDTRQGEGAQGAPDDDDHDDDMYSLDEAPAPPKGSNRKTLTMPRKIVAVVALVCFIATAVFTGMNFAGFKDFISGGQEAVTVTSNPYAVWMYVGIMAAATAEIISFLLALTHKREKKPFMAQVEVGSRKLSKRTLTAAIMILLAIPATIYVGIFFLDDYRFYFIAILIVLETMVPFFLVFEGRKPQARELVILAVLIAIGVAGRSAFFMVPQFKPVVAVVIIAGVAFGGEAGFLVGALTMFVSNMMFGQGPWTPWQMFACGIIGFLAGVLFKKGFLLRSRGPLCFFGGMSALVIYGILMNTSMIFTLHMPLNLTNFLYTELQGIPFDLVHAFATVVFLAIISKPMLEKLDRIKVKYGLVEVQTMQMQPQGQSQSPPGNRPDKVLPEGAAG